MTSAALIHVTFSLKIRTSNPLVNSRRVETLNALFGVACDRDHLKSRPSVGQLLGNLLKRRKAWHRRLRRAINSSRPGQRGSDTPEKRRHRRRCRPNRPRPTTRFSTSTIRFVGVAKALGLVTGTDLKLAPPARIGGRHALIDWRIYLRPNLRRPPAIVDCGDGA